MPTNTYTKHYTATQSYSHAKTRRLCGVCCAVMCNAVCSMLFSCRMKKGSFLLIHGHLSFSKAHTRNPLDLHE